MQDRPEDVLSQHIATAQAALDKRQYEIALHEWTAAIGCDPNNSRSFLGRGFANMMLKKSDEALSDFDMAIKLDPGNIKAFLNRGALHIENERLPEALADTTRGLELAEESGDIDSQVGALMNRAGLYNRQRLSDQALADFQSALELTPESPWVHYAVARFYAEKGQAEEAATELKSAIEYEPLLRRSAFLDQAFNLVRGHPAVVSVLGDPAMAIPNPETSLDYVCRAQLYEQMGLIQQALADYHAALGVDPQDAHALYLLAASYGRMHRAEEAAQFLLAAIRINPTWREQAKATTDFTNLSHIPSMASALGLRPPLS
jgi:tetratricopeptide (TPR) repeat protein